MLNDTPPHQKSEPEYQQRQEEEKESSPFTKRILIVDDDLDVTFTFKKAFEQANRISGNNISFHVNIYNDPLVALSEFKPDFYDLLLVDINMPRLNGFDFCAKVLEMMLTQEFALCLLASLIGRH